MRVQQPLIAAITVVASALVCAVALDFGSPIAQGAVSHKINLEQANAKVAERAILAVETKSSHQMLDIDPDGEGIRTETTVTCRRTGDHTARCPWRALAYVGDETVDAAFACNGIARVRLVGRLLRFDPSGSDPNYMGFSRVCFF
jgi:hypothetical protein